MSKPQVLFADNDYCFACGSKNPLGLHLQFYRDGELYCTKVLPKPHWQGFLGVMHGGLQTTIMDDLMSNHLFRVEGVWVATTELKVRFRRPVPLDQELLFTSSVKSRSGRRWELQSHCVLAEAPDKPPLTAAIGTFVEIPPPS